MELLNKEAVLEARLQQFLHIITNLLVKVLGSGLAQASLDRRFLPVAHHHHCMAFLWLLQLPLTVHRQADSFQNIFVGLSPLFMELQYYV